MKTSIAVALLFGLTFSQSTHHHNHDSKKKNHNKHENIIKIDDSGSDNSNLSKVVSKSDEIVGVDVGEVIETHDPDKLKFTLFPESDFYVPANLTAGMVASLDYRNNVSYMFNGKTGAAIIFSYELERGFYLPPEATDKTWNMKRASFNDYFGKTISSAELYELGESRGIHFDPTTITDDISEEMQGILATLSLDYSSKCDPAGIFFYISKITAEDLKTSLSGFKDVMMDTQTPIRGDFKWLIGIFQGMGDFFAPFDGGINSLSVKGVKLSLEKILSSPTPIHVFIYFLQELNPHFELGDTLEDVVNHDDKFFTMISKLAGDVSYGFDGFVHVVSVVINVIIGEESAQNLGIFLHEYYKDPRTENRVVRQKWKSSIETLDKTLQTLNLTESFDALTKTTKAILDNKWFINNVNASAVTEAILEGENHPKTIESILKLLEKETTK